MYHLRNIYFKGISDLKCSLPIIKKNFHAKKESNNVSGPLDGIVILDLTRILAGPYCTMILGDLGAKVIKVEKPFVGDETRTWGPPFIGSQSCYFLSVNRNKKSIAIDIKKGADLLKNLAMKADILIENFVPGTMEKFELNYENLSKANPKLIYCSISGYGSSGPYVHRGGYDVIAASLGGLMHITGPKDGEPCKVGVAMTDLATGLYAHGAIMAALIERSKTGKGQNIECNLLSTQVTSLVNLAINYLNDGREARRWGTAHESIVPYQSFMTKDKRWITIGAGNSDLFYQLCDKIGLLELKSNEKYATNTTRVENRKELISMIETAIAEKTCEEWLNVFKECKFPYGPINDMKHVFEDPQVQHNDMVQEIEGMKLINPAVKMSSGGNYIRATPPLLGQHTREILKEFLQMSDEDINTFYKNGIVA